MDKKMISISATPDLPISTHWEHLSQGRELVPLNKPCSGCAITTGFYLEYADLLKLEPVEMQDKVLKTWFCHNNCNRGCAGIQQLFTNKPNQ